MKKIILPLLLACCAPLNAAGDCASNTEACFAAGKAAVSPFLAASALPAKKTAAAIVQAKKAGPSIQPDQPAAVETSSVPAAARAPAENAGSASSPLWLLVVGAGLAGLYFYLGGKNKKGKRK